MGNSLYLLVSKSGDWQGIYVNGELNYEGHSIDSLEWIEIITMNMNFSSIRRFEVSQDYLDERGNLPNYFGNIPSECLNHA